MDGSVAAAVFLAAIEAGNGKAWVMGSLFLLFLVYMIRHLMLSLATDHYGQPREGNLHAKPFRRN